MTHRVKISASVTHLECSPIVTFPITDADGAMKLLAPGNAGATPSTETIRLDGTSFSVYLATSILAPKLSRAALCRTMSEEEKTRKQHQDEEGKRRYS